MICCMAFAECCGQRALGRLQDRTLDTVDLRLQLFCLTGCRVRGFGGVRCPGCLFHPQPVSDAPHPLPVHIAVNHKLHHPGILHRLSRDPHQIDPGTFRRILQKIRGQCPFHRILPVGVPECNGLGISVPPIVKYNAQPVGICFVLHAGAEVVFGQVISAYLDINDSVHLPPRVLFFPTITKEGPVFGPPLEENVIYGFSRNLEMKYCCPLPVTFTVLFTLIVPLE